MFAPDYFNSGHYDLFAGVFQTNTLSV